MEERIKNMKLCIQYQKEDIEIEKTKLFKKIKEDFTSENLHKAGIIIERMESELKTLESNLKMLYALEKIGG